MLRRSMTIGSIAVVLAAGGCSSDDSPSTPAPKNGPLCERIGTDALREALPSFEPDPPGEGESTACVRLATGASPGDFLRITIEPGAPGTEEECVNLAHDSGEATWLPAAQLAGVGDFACGTVVSAEGVLVTILARRAATHVSISYGRTPGEVTGVRDAAVELARTVMRRV
jgi:hypothetical protein